MNLNEMSKVELQQRRYGIVEKLNESLQDVDNDAAQIAIRGLQAELIDVSKEIDRRDGRHKEEAAEARRNFEVKTKWSSNGTAAGVSGGYQSASIIVAAKESVRSAFEERGLLRDQERYEHVTVGEMARGLFAPGKVSPEVRAALAEGADATGGISVPSLTLTQFIDTLRANVVCFKAGAQTVALESDSTTIARTATDPVAAWRAEAGTVAQSEPSFEGVVFTPRSLDVLIKASREVIEDSVNISQAIDAAITGAFAVEMDRVALIGSGTPPEPRGISTTTNVGAVASGGALADYDKLVDTFYEIMVDNAVRGPVSIALHPRTLASYAKLKTGLASDKTPLPQPAFLEGVPRYTTTAFSITEAPGTATRLIMGSFDQLFFGIRAALRIAVARELFAGTGQVGFFANARMDVALAHPQSFAQLTGIVP
jgi:HK97 family phage major capsid protein